MGIFVCNNNVRVYGPRDLHWTETSESHHQVMCCALYDQPTRDNSYTAKKTGNTWGRMNE